jgi:hypothetical protein
MQGTHTHIPETNHVPKGYIVAAILSLLFMVPLFRVPALALLFFYVSTLLLLFMCLPWLRARARACVCVCETERQLYVYLSNLKYLTQPKYFAVVDWKMLLRRLFLYLFITDVSV